MKTMFTNFFMPQIPKDIWFKQFCLANAHHFTKTLEFKNVPWREQVYI